MKSGKYHQASEYINAQCSTCGHLSRLSWAVSLPASTAADSKTLAPSLGGGIQATVEYIVPEVVPSSK